MLNGTKQVDKLGFDRMEIANIKRCFQANSLHYKKIDKLMAKVRELGAAIEAEEKLTESWEAPVKTLTEQKLGFVMSSRDVLAAHADFNAFIESNPKVKQELEEHGFVFNTTEEAETSVQPEVESSEETPEEASVETEFPEA